MKKIVKLIRDNITVYSGDLWEIPLKEEYIIKKCIELFDDDDPCIINRTFATKKIISEIEGTFAREKCNSIALDKYNNPLVSAIDIENINECTMELDVLR